MVSINILVQGSHQRVQNGALLLSLSTWHLYPDMVVHGIENERYQIQWSSYQRGRDPDYWPSEY